VGNQNNINLAQSWIIRTGDGSAGIVENSGAIRIFKHKRPVAATELAIVATQGCDLHHVVIGGSRHSGAE
jgi:hypothetical protein